MQKLFKPVFLIPLTMSGLMLIDIILRCYEIGFQNALLNAINDPGKVFFHLVILPLMAYVLLSRFSVGKLFKSFYRAKKGTAGTFSKIVFLLAVPLFVVAVFFDGAARDVHSGFCERMPTPDNFSNPQVRNKMTALWIEYHREARTQIGLLSSAKDSAVSRIAGSFREKYLAESHSSMQWTKHDTSTFFWTCPIFTRHASVTVYLDFILTLLSLLTAAFFAILLLIHFVSIVLFHLRGLSFSDNQWSGLLSILSLAFLWTYCRYYSEYYINFFDYSERVYSGFFTGIVVIAGMWITTLVIYWRITGKSFIETIGKTEVIFQIIGLIVAAVASVLLNIISVKTAILLFSDLRIAYWLLIYLVLTALILIATVDIRSNPNEFSFRNMQADPDGDA